MGDYDNRSENGIYYHFGYCIYMVELIEVFKEFGLPGVVIGALFYQNIQIMRELRAMNESTDSRLMEQAKQHNEERKEWRASLDRLAESAGESA